MNLRDPALHIPLALAFGAAWAADPIAGCCFALWVREAAQASPGDFLRGMDPRGYSRQRHLEIWPPGIIAGLLWHLLT